jgi:general secretion pathway protein L
METLLIRPVSHMSSDTESIIVEWLVLDSNLVPAAQVEQGTLESAAEVSRQRKVIFLIPSEDLLLTEVSLQTRNRQQLAKAIPYRLEEELADDVENLHFALGVRQDNGSHPVAVIARQTLDRWLKALQAVDLSPKSMIPELLCLPFEETRWSLMIEDNRVLMRNASYRGFSVEAENLETIINLMRDPTEEHSLPKITVYRCDQNAQNPLPLNLPVEKEQYADAPLMLMADNLDVRNNINLLQGGYKQSDDAIQLLRPWRLAAALAGAWLILQIATTSMDLWRLNRESHELQSSIEQVFRKTFPEAQRVVNPRVQMEQSLKSLLAAQQGDDGGNFLSLVDAGGRAIQAFNGIAINTLDYRDDRLELALEASDLQSLEKIKQQLENEGLAASIESAETSGQKVEARLLVQRNKG